MEGYTYILQCSDGSFYTGSTNDLQLRLQQHILGEGSKHTSSRLPVTLVYFERHSKIEDAFNREQQIKKWNRKKKLALINQQPEKLPHLSKNNQLPKKNDGL